LHHNQNILLSHASNSPFSQNNRNIIFILHPVS